MQKLDDQEMNSEYQDESEFGLDNMLMTSSSFLTTSPPSHTLTRSVSLDETMLYPNSSLFTTPPTGTTGNSTDAKVTFAFPNKLYNLLEVSDESIIGWLPNGKGFRVYELETFTSQLLPKFFNHSKFESFQRQLNIYGFKRVLKGTLVGAYFNMYFQRGRPELLANIKRTVASRSRSIDGSSPTVANGLGGVGKRKRRSSVTNNLAPVEFDDDMQLWSASLDTGMDDLMSESNGIFPPFPFISKSDAHMSSQNLLSGSMDNTSLLESKEPELSLAFPRSVPIHPLSLQLPYLGDTKSKDSKSTPGKKQLRGLSQLQKTMAQYSHLSSAFVSPREPTDSSSPNGTSNRLTNGSALNGDSTTDSPMNGMTIDFNASGVLCMADVPAPLPTGDASPKSPKGRPRTRKSKYFDSLALSPSSSELLPNGLHRPIPLTPGSRALAEEDLTEISIDPFVLAQYGEIFYMPPEGGKAIRIKANYISDHSSRGLLNCVSSDTGSAKRSSPAKKSSPPPPIDNNDPQRPEPELLHTLPISTYGHEHNTDLHSDLHLDLYPYTLAPTPLINTSDMSHTHEIPFETIFADSTSCYSR